MIRTAMLAGAALLAFACQSQPLDAVVTRAQSNGFPVGILSYTPQ